MRCLDGITDSMDMSLSKFLEIVKDREAWCAIVYKIIKSWTLLSRAQTLLIEMLYGILLGYIIWICSLIECHMKVSMYADWACHM